MSRLANAAAALEAIVPVGARLALWKGGPEPRLHPSEEAAVARAVESRRAEFAKGRACARRALEELGGPSAPIGVGEQRQPIWPEGFVGSITHCDGLVAAVVARDTHLVTIGLDAELRSPLMEEVRDEVLHPDEWSADYDVGFDTLLFSAKESVYKALFPVTGLVLDLLDVRVRLDVPRGAFVAMSASPAGALARGLGELRGKFALTGEYVLTTCSLERGSGQPPDRRWG